MPRPRIARAGEIVHGADRPDGQAGQPAQSRGHRVGNADPKIGVGLGQVARRKGPHRERLGLDHRRPADG